MLILVFLTIIISTYVYVAYHKDELLSKIKNHFNTTHYGTLEVANIQPNFWKQFPNVSLEMQNVIIKDTHCANQHQELLNIEKVFAKLRYAPLLWGKVHISKMVLSNGDFKVFENDEGYSNLNALKKREIILPKKRNWSIRHISIENINFYFVSSLRKKYFEINCPHQNIIISSNKNEKRIHTSGSFYVRQCQFSTDKGSYFKGKELKLNCVLKYNTDKELLSFTNQKIVIDRNKLLVSGTFNLKEKDSPFSLEIKSKSIVYKDAISWLSPNIFEKINKYSFQKPLALTILLKGKLTNQATPSVQLSARSFKNSIHTAWGDLNACNFDLSYDNGTYPHLGDSFSTIQIPKLNALYTGISFSADSTIIENLKVPKICTHIKSNFKISKLNEVLKTKSFSFQDGDAEVDLSYCGIWKVADSVAINGHLKIKNASLSYLPRALKFNQCNLNLLFKNRNIYLVNSTLNTRKSKLFLSAFSNNFISDFLKNPEKINVTANINSEKIDLNEFQTFLQKRKTQKKKNQKQRTDYLDNAFAASNAYLKLDVKNLDYKKFKAKDIIADISLLKDRLELTDVSLLHSSGKINVRGSIHEAQAESSTFNISAAIEDVLVDSLLYSFDNFGQSTFKDDNIKGIVSIHTNLNGKFDKNARLITSSLYGYASFVLSHARLINFEPLDKMGRLFFKRKRLANVHFEQLKNTFTIEGNKITIPPMWVNTDLIDMQVQGIYNLSIGTDLLIEIPLFKFSQSDIENSPELSRSKGFRLYVRGKDDEKGNLHFSVKMRNEEINAARAERKKNRDKRKKKGK